MQALKSPTLINPTSTQGYKEYVYPDYVYILVEINAIISYSIIHNSNTICLIYILRCFK